MNAPTSSSSQSLGLNLPSLTLLGISPEIRSVIYQHLFPPEGSYKLELCPARWDKNTAFPPEKKNKIYGPGPRHKAGDVHGLVLSCRKIYLETINIFYSSIRVVTYSPFTTMCLFQKIGRLNLMALKDFNFKLDSSGGTAGHWCAFFKALLESPVSTAGGEGAGASFSDRDRCLDFRVSGKRVRVPVRNKETGVIVSWEKYDGRTGHGPSPSPTPKVLYWRAEPDLRRAGPGSTFLEALNEGPLFSADVERGLSSGEYDEAAYRLFKKQFCKIFGHPET